ncbi:MAG: type IV secretion system DNA-binding domain-containing protein [Candidatus Nealsonbacteria bacterium]|nr:type IV secretion system DNA-binding domain-containing protein [Candidatus Nealsonbacteria bacterium]
MNESEINFFAETTFRHERRKFGIKLDDRRKHMYFIGKTGMGKTNAMANMAIQDIQAGRGIGFIDPHGETAQALLDFVPSERVNDVVFFNPADLDFPISFNVMEKVDVEHRHLVASGLMGVFKKLWPDVWSARMEYILNNAILALLEYPGSTLLGINRMLGDPEYRAKVLEKVTDPVIRAFWLQEYARYTQRYEVEATAAIQNKVGQFISAPLIRNIIGQVSSKIDMREIMDSHKILIMDVSKGRIGEDNSMLLGSLLVTKLQLAAMSRVDIPEEQRQDFFLYVDEFQNFATESFANILSEARKYRLDLILGHQYITQLIEEVRDAVFGNMGTLVCFRIGAEDAEFLEREFSPDFTAADLVNLGKYNVYLKLMIDGLTGRPFSAQTLPPILKPEKSSREKIIYVSRERYSVARSVVEDKISRWTGLSEGKALPPVTAAEGALYDAQCETCKKWTKVVFKPDGKRPVYCKTCLKKVQREREKPAETPIERPPASSPPLSLAEALTKEPVSFSAKKERPRAAPEMDKVKEAIKEALAEEKHENDSRP